MKDIEQPFTGAFLAHSLKTLFKRAEADNVAIRRAMYNDMIRWIGNDPDIAAFTACRFAEDTKKKNPDGSFWDDKPSFEALVTITENFGQILFKEKDMATESLVAFLTEATINYEIEKNLRSFALIPEKKGENLARNCIKAWASQDYRAAEAFSKCAATCVKPLAKGDVYEDGYNEIRQSHALDLLNLIYWLPKLPNHTRMEMKKRLKSAISVFDLNTIQS